MEAGSLESPMVEHHQEVHPEEELKVSMEVVGHEPSIEKLWRGFSSVNILVAPL